MFRFKYKYPQSFLEQLAKDLGLKLIKVKQKLISKNKVSILLMGKLSKKIYYADFKYKNEKTL